MTGTGPGTEREAEADVENSNLAERNAELEKDLAAAVEQLNDSLTLNRELMSQLDELRTRTADARRLQKDYMEMRNSIAFRMGSLIVGAFTSPGRRTLLLPYQLAKLLLERAVVPKWARIERTERK
jgi:hypothetical protein